MPATLIKSKTKRLKRDSNACACFNLRMAARAITQTYDEGMRETGLRVTQLSVLGPCMKMGPVTICELAEATCTDRTTITRNIKILETDGYLSVERGEDAREKVICITPKGTDVMERAYPIWRKIQGRFVDQLGTERFERLLKDLAAVVEALQS